MKRHHKQAWPRVLGSSKETACHFCDTIFQIELIKEGEKATCQTCAQPLYQNRPKSLQHAISYALTGILLFNLLLFFPFMRLDAQGLVIVMPVLDAVKHMLETGGWFIAAAVTIFAIALPLLQLIVILYICIPLLFGKTLPFVVLIIRMQQTLQPWIMIEVFFLATVVSLIKLVKLADVELLCGFWSLIAIMMCIAGAFASIDKLELWDRIEVALEKNPKLD